MKKVKIASGFKRIDDSDPNATLFRLRDVLTEHRSLLISRIVADLPSYIDYKFHVKTTSRQLDTIKDQLHSIRSAVLDLDRYNQIVDHFYQNDITFIGSELFLREVDECIDAVLNISQLKLVD